MRIDPNATGSWTLTDEQLAGMEMWDRDVMLDERHRAVGAMLVSAAIREIRRLRSMEQRLLEWAEQLEAARSGSMLVDGQQWHGGVGPFIAAELRNRMKGPA